MGRMIRELWQIRRNWPEGITADREALAPKTKRDAA